MSQKSTKRIFVSFPGGTTSFTLWGDAVSFVEKQIRQNPSREVTVWCEDL